MWLIAAVVTLVAIGLTVSAKTWITSREAAANSVPSPLTQANSGQTQEQGIIRLLTSGFNPAELNGSPGQYRIVATRPNKDEQVVLQLSWRSGGVIQELVMPQEKLDWTTLIELQEGSYTLSVANHPEWNCLITIQ